MPQFSWPTPSQSVPKGQNGNNIVLAHIVLVQYGETQLEHIKMDGQTEADIFPTSFTFGLFFKDNMSGISCESSAKQTIHMKYQDLFTLKKDYRLLQILLGALRRLNVDRISGYLRLYL